MREGKENAMAIETAEKTVILHIGGMDCAECAGNVEEAIRELPGVSRVASPLRR